MTRVTDPLLDHLGRIVRQEIFPVGLVIDDRYELRHRIARGGMGEIFYAWDRKLDRPVAMKVLARELGAPEWAARFGVEAETTARLDHPGVVPIFDRGFLPDGRLYFTMKYVEGRTLDQIEAPRLEILVEAAAVVAHAHARGVAHCDLKPANVMADDEGRVFVLDWGIARVRDEFRSGRVMGTVEYMAPEQARGEGADRRSDVYALGAILRRFLPSPAPRDLDAVCRKALEADPARRYPSAREFADDLRRHLRGEPVTASTSPRLDRLFRFLARHRWVGAALLVGVAASVGFGVPQYRKYRREREYRREAEARREAEREASRMLEEARPLVEKGRYLDEAERLVRAALLRAPDFAVALDLLGRIQELQGRVAEAESSWRSALRADPEYGRARLRLGRLLVHRAFWAGVGASEREREARRAEAQRVADEAADEISRGLASGADDAFLGDLCEAMLAYARRDREALRAKCEKAVVRWDREGAEDFWWLLSHAVAGEERLRALDRAIELRPHFPLARFSRGFARQERGDLRGAADDYAEAGGGVAAYNNLGAVLLALEDLEGALAALDRAIALEPGRFEARVNRATVRRRRKDFAGALEDLNVAIELRPGDAAARYNRGVFFHETGDLDSALRDYDEAVRRDPAFAEAGFNRALVLRGKGDLEGAAREFDRVLRLRPGDARLRFAQGEVASARGDWKGAADAFGQAIRIDPAFTEAYSGRAAARRRLGDRAGAIDDLTEVVRLRPQLAEAWYERAMVRREIGEPEPALQDLDEAVRLRPGFVEARVARGELRKAAGRLPGAIEDFTAAIALRPSDPVLWHNRGVLRQIAADWEGAVADYTEAIRIDPDYLEAHYRRALVYRYLGKRALAVADLRRVLELAPPEWSRRPAVELLLRELQRGQ